MAAAGGRSTERRAGGPERSAGGKANRPEGPEGGDAASSAMGAALRTHAGTLIDHHVQSRPNVMAMASRGFNDAERGTTTAAGPAVVASGCSGSPPLRSVRSVGDCVVTQEKPADAGQRRWAPSNTASCHRLVRRVETTIPGSSVDAFPSTRSGFDLLICCLKQAKEPTPPISWLLRRSWRRACSAAPPGQALSRS